MKFLQLLLGLFLYSSTIGAQTAKDVADAILGTWVANEKVLTIQVYKKGKNIVLK